MFNVIVGLLRSILAVVSRHCFSDNAFISYCSYTCCNNLVNETFNAKSVHWGQRRRIFKCVFQTSDCVTTDVRFHLSTLLERRLRKRNVQVYLRKNLHLNKQFRIYVNVRNIFRNTYWYFLHIRSVAVSIDLGILPQLRPCFNFKSNFVITAGNKHNFERTEVLG